MKKLSKTQKDIRESVASQLGNKRRAMGVTQADLAEKLGTQKSNISRFESGEQNISIDYISAYAEALGQRATVVMEDISDYTGETAYYYLKLYDETLLEFSMTPTFEGPVTIDLLDYDASKLHLMPIGLELNSTGLRAWLKSRCIPSHRAFVREILQSLNLDSNNLKGIIDICKGLSLNDSYWVSPRQFNTKFKDINLYENSFDTVLSLVAYVGMYQPVYNPSASPELTTGGTLRKGWRRDGKDLWLYKGGSEADSGFAGNEPYSEYYASQIAKAMDLNYVEYDLRMWKGILASCCRLFTNKYVSYVPVGNVPGIYEIEDVFDLYKKLGSEYYDELCDMLVFDALIYNKDRHFENFGLLRDNKSGSFIAPAPVFDNGLSLFACGDRSDFDNLKAYRHKWNNPYERSWEEVLRLALHDRQKEKLARLGNFKFREHPYCNLPQWRLQKLSEFIQFRVKELLD